MGRLRYGGCDAGKPCGQNDDAPEAKMTKQGPGGAGHAGGKGHEATPASGAPRPAA
jgi:hypothetical protein